jgi:hypothetical protein
VIATILFAFFLQILGYIPLASLDRSGRGFLSFALALPLGATIWVICGVVLLALGIPVGLMSVAALSVACALGSLVFVDRRGARVSHASLILAGMVIVATVPYFVSSMAWTSDSLFMVLMGEDILHTGSFSSVVRDWYLTGYPFAVPLLSLQGLAADPARLPEILTVLPVSLTLLVVDAAIQAAPRQRALAIIAAIAAMAAVFLSAAGRLQAIYVNGHVLTACLILGFFSIPEDQPRLATLLRSALAVGVAVSRVEGVLFAILMLALEPVAAVTRWRRVVPATAVAVAATFLLGHVAFNLAAVLDIINPRIAWTLIAIGWLYLVFLLVLYGFDLDWLLEHLRRLTLTAIILCSVLAIVWNPEHMMMVFYNLGSNMMLTGGWGIVWPAISLAVVLAAVYQRGALLADPRILFVIGYVLLLICLGAVNKRPYVVGPFDSGNRLLFQMLPLLMAALFAQTMSLPKRLTSPQT